MGYACGYPGGSVSESGQSVRGAALQAALEKRMTAWFGSRRWLVCSELSYMIDDVTVKRGEFLILNDKVFRTPFGNKGKHGYILQEVEPDTGADVWHGNEPSRASFGWVIIRNAKDKFPQ